MIRAKALPAMVAAGALTLALALGAPAGANAADDPVVAVVNGKEIHRSDVAEARTRLPGQLNGVPEQAIYPLLLNSLIDTQLVSAEARKAGLADSAEIKAQLERIENQLLERAYLRSYIGERLTEDVLKARYETFVAEHKGRQEVKARHILVETEEQAKEVIAELGKGADFAELARSRSIGPSGPRGGDLGYFGQGEMVSEFAQAAFALEVGAVTQAPVKTQFGWHVIKVDDRRDATPPSFEEASGQLRADASREIVAGLVKGLREKAEIDIRKPN